MTQLYVPEQAYLNHLNEFSKPCAAICTAGSRYGVPERDNGFTVIAVIQMK